MPFGKPSSNNWNDNVDTNYNTMEQKWWNSSKQMYIWLHFWMLWIVWSLFLLLHHLLNSVGFIKFNDLKHKKKKTLAEVQYDLHTTHFVYSYVCTGTSWIHKTVLPRTVMQCYVFQMTITYNIFKRVLSVLLVWLMTRCYKYLWPILVSNRESVLAYEI